MRAEGVLAVLVGLCLAMPAGGAAVELPLPDLVGEYAPSANERVVMIQLPALPEAIHGAWLRLSGVAEVAQIACDEGGVGPWPSHIRALMPDDQGRMWSVERLMESAGVYAWTAAFSTRPAEPADWIFLLDGQAELTLHAGLGAIPLGCVVQYEPTVWIQEAVFILDADFPVPAEASTWGRIKALFR